MFTGKKKISSAVVKGEISRILTDEVNRNVEMIVEQAVPH